MKKINKKILEESPEGISNYIKDFVSNTWEGTDNVGGLKRNSGIDSLIEEAFNCGWNKGANKFLAKTIKLVSNSLETRKKELINSLSGKDQFDIFADFDSPVIKNEVLMSEAKSDSITMALSKMLDNISRAQLFNDASEKKSASIQERADLLLKRYRGLSQLRPHFMSESVNQGCSGLSVSSSLEDSKHMNKTLLFSGYDDRESLEDVSFPERLSAPYTAWELNERSIIPTVHLVSTIINYGEELRMFYNHQLIHSKVEEIKNEKDWDNKSNLTL